ncbi:PAC2 family protein [Micrococcus porci]|uniref:proteasome assembly chaperone family protein n=1 Tax=Micrococcus TaxID=1269 RepID=UPI001CCACB46|nr:MULTISPECIES: PAC2 family protein [Micrococcus]MCG7422663.1 PAC2 family protein [Micrococcus sp. ACRRV]UBH23866.1 PAC2 family protein [Micrococcus porci]
MDEQTDPGSLDGAPSPEDRLGALRAHLTATVPEVEDGSRPPAVLLLAFEGWNDAGEAATGALAELSAQWEAAPAGVVCDGEYYDYQVTRPVVHRDADGLGTLEWPALRVHEARLDAHGAPVPDGEAVPADGLRVLLASGVEPNVRWRAYVEELLRWAEAEGVDAVLTLGALLADVPHSRPLRARPTSPLVAVRVAVDAGLPAYEGPTGIVGVVTDEAARRGTASLSLWGAVPHYVAQAPSPKTLLGLVEAVEDLLHVELLTHALRDDAQAWQRGVDELAREDPEVASYVRRLEESQDAQELPEASGEAIAREFERYLRGRGRD